MAGKKKAAKRATKKPTNAKPTKLPREIAGLKLSKSLRKEGGKLIDLMKNPAVSGVALAGLAALTAALRDSPNKDKPAKPARTDDLGQGAALLGTMLAAKVMDSVKRKH